MDSEPLTNQEACCLDIKSPRLESDLDSDDGCTVTRPFESIQRQILYQNMSCFAKLGLYQQVSNTEVRSNNDTACLRPFAGALMERGLSLLKAVGYCQAIGCDTDCQWT